MVSEWQIETILRNNSIVTDGLLIILEENKFPMVCKEICSILKKKQAEEVKP